MTIKALFFLIFASCVVVFFAIAANYGDIAGHFGRVFMTENYALFGAVGKVDIIVLLIPIYLLYKNPSITISGLELFIAVVLGLFSILLAQAYFYHLGRYGLELIGVLEPVVGKAGIILLIVASFLLALIMANASLGLIKEASIRGFLAKLFGRLWTLIRGACALLIGLVASIYHILYIALQGVASLLGGTRSKDTRPLEEDLPPLGVPSSGLGAREETSYNGIASGEATLAPDANSHMGQGVAGINVAGLDTPPYKDLADQGQTLEFANKPTSLSSWVKKVFSPTPMSDATRTRQEGSSFILRSNTAYLGPSEPIDGTKNVQKPALGAAIQNSPSINSTNTPRLEGRGEVARGFYINNANASLPQGLAMEMLSSLRIDAPTLMRDDADYKDLRVHLDMHTKNAPPLDESDGIDIYARARGAIRFIENNGAPLRREDFSTLAPMKHSQYLTSFYNETMDEGAPSLAMPEPRGASIVIRRDKEDAKDKDTLASIDPTNKTPIHSNSLEQKPPRIRVGAMEGLERAINRTEPRGIPSYITPRVLENDEAYNKRHNILYGVREIGSEEVATKRAQDIANRPILEALDIIASEDVKISDILARGHASVEVENALNEKAHSTVQAAQTPNQLNEKIDSIKMPPMPQNTLKEKVDSTAQAPNSLNEKTDSMNPTPQMPPMPQNALKENQLSEKVHSTQTARDSALPTYSLLASHAKGAHEIDLNEIDEKTATLLNKLKVFKVRGDITSFCCGPVVTRFEFKPDINVKVGNIVKLQDDLAMALKAQSIRIQAPVPGRDVVGIEIPNKNREMIYLRELLEDEEFVNSSFELAIALGKDIVGKSIFTDLAKLPHLLIAGTTGSGKSVGINAMLISLLYKHTANTLRLIIIDPKKVEFASYEEIPHLLTPIITDASAAITALIAATAEMDRRYDVMGKARCKNIISYNAKATSSPDMEPLPYIVIIIDELADLMMTGGKEAEQPIARLAQMGRASGMHLIVATQRPSTDVVTGILKTNLPSRLSYRVGSGIDSKVIIDGPGAEKLIGNGDGLFISANTSMRIHAPFYEESELNAITDYLRSTGAPMYEASYLGNDIGGSDTSGVVGDVEAELLLEAREIMRTENNTSASNLQRRMRIGYNKASLIVEALENEGFLSRPNASGKRSIL